MKLTPMEATCNHAGCGRQFKASVPHKGEFRRLYESRGWRLRGTVTGWLVYCPRHAD